MIGAIIGDIVEAHTNSTTRRTTTFQCLLMDRVSLTTRFVMIAVADAILSCTDYRKPLCGRGAENIPIQWVWIR